MPTNMHAQERLGANREGEEDIAVLATVGPFENIHLSNAQQEKLFNLFTGYSVQSPVPYGDNLLKHIREGLEARKLVHPMVTVNYKIYKRIRVFLSDHGVSTPSTGASGGFIINRIIHTIWSRPEDAEECDRAIAKCRAIKSGEHIPISATTHSQSPQANPFAIPPDPATPKAGSPAQV